MSVIKTYLNTGSAIQSDYEDGAIWSDGVAPVAGDTVIIAGVKSADEFFIGPLIDFDAGSTNIPVALFHGTGGANPRTPGYTVSSQTIDLQGTAGPARLFLQNSTLSQDTISVSGTAVVSGFFNDTISGVLSVGTAAETGFLQFQLFGTGFGDNYIPGYTPSTQFKGIVTVGSGSTLQMEAITGSGLPPANIANSGTITVGAGGTFLADDNVGNPSNTGSDNGTTFINTGRVLVSGAAGLVTSAKFNTNTTGSGTFTVSGNGASLSATTLEFDGNVRNTHVVISGATVLVQDASLTISTPDIAGYNVSGGSMTFIGPGMLLLAQPDLTTSVFNAQGNQVERPNGQHPFTTPIHGFGAGDTIGLEGKYSSFSKGDYFTVWNPTANTLTVDNSFGLPGAPDVLARLTLDGSYVASGFTLSGNNATGELDIFYTPPGTH